MITPFHMAPSCLALNGYLLNTDSDYSMMLGNKVWEERERKKVFNSYSSSCHSPTENDYRLFMAENTMNKCLSRNKKLFIFCSPMQLFLNIFSPTI